MTGFWKPYFGKRERSASLPERWRLGRRRAALSCLAAVGIFSGFLCTQGGAGALDSRWLCARFLLREWVFGNQRDPRIVIVGIDDKSFANWPEPFIMWGGHMADAINQLRRSGARVIALDWVQPIETDALLHQNNDQKLGQALSATSRVVCAKFIKPDGTYLLPAPSLRYSLPDAYKDEGASSMGFAELYSPGSLLTSFYPAISDAQTKSSEVSFALRIAQKSDLLHRAVPSPDKPLLINFGNGAGQHDNSGTFEWASFYDVAMAKAPDARWKNKIVLIGSVEKGNQDEHYVPFFIPPASVRLLKGVEVQAHAVKTLLDNNAVIEPSASTVWLLAAILGAAGVVAFALWSWGRAALVCITAAVIWALASFELFCGQNFHLPLIVPLASLVFGVALMGGYRALNEERERAQVMKIWGRHQDPRLIEVLLSHPEWRGGQGREMVVTVLFADLKDFTKTVESLSPAQALEALNRYLSLLSATILAHSGVVDKFLGDGLMAQWGAPAPSDDHALSALKACLDIENRLRALTPQLRAVGDVSFEVRLTLHTGPVVAGPLGSDERLEYTIIGDTVNVTSRLQETAKELGCDFLISETTRAALGLEEPGLQISFGRETEVAIRGRQQPLRVFEVLGNSSSAVIK